MRKICCMVNILLSTYNGSKFLKEFLRSLEKQTFRNWNLLVRDDKSTDNTLSILEDFKRKYPHQVFILQDNLGNLGACKSFLTC
jgi:rhamnosyltransferase